jgi:hypothetical protein
MPLSYQALPDLPGPARNSTTHSARQVWGSNPECEWISHPLSRFISLTLISQAFVVEWMKLIQSSRVNSSQISRKYST